MMVFFLIPSYIHMAFMIKIPPLRNKKGQYSYTKKQGEPAGEDVEDEQC